MTSAPAVHHRKENIPHALGLRAGDLVEIRSEPEILSTLDDDGRLDGLPFMPEMLRYCGQRVRVFRRADKTCDTIASYTSRRMTDAVHLTGLRCDGSAHNGCQAACLIFWKEAWLQRVRPDQPDQPARPAPPDQPAQTQQAAQPEQAAQSRQGAQPEQAAAAVDAGPAAAGSEPARERLAAATQRPDPDGGPTPRYVCQATELLAATSRLRWWDPRQYARELATGNVTPGTFARTVAIAGYNAASRRLVGRRYPHVAGTLTRTPSRRLDLRPGELVRVRSREEIMATLDRNQKNRGMWFDAEMVPFCGRQFRVLRRVDRIVDERSGKMLDITGDCIILDGVACGGLLSQNRLFCPRNVYPYWREIWLERVEPAP